MLILERRSSIKDDKLVCESMMSLVIIDINPVNFDFEIMVALNQIARDLFEENGVYGVKFDGQIKYILNASLYPPLGVDYPMTILERAAFYWVRIATKQAYHNGNKRTALLSALAYLDLNGYIFDEEALVHETGKDMYGISVDIANGNLTEANVYDLLFKYSAIKLFE